MNKDEKPFGLKTGYSTKNKWKTEIENAKKNTCTSTDPKYPTGWAPTILLAISLIIGLGLALGLSPKNNVPHQLFIATSWYNTVWYVFGIAMCWMAFWAIGRTDFLALARFSLVKFSRVIKFDVLRRKLRPKVFCFAIDEVNTLDEFLEFLKVRNKLTKKIFYINLGIYSSLFVIWTIVMSILNAV